MLNVDKVFTSQWIPLDNVRDCVSSVIDELPSASAITDAQKAAILSGLNTSKTGEYTPTTPFADFQANNGVVIPDLSSCLKISESIYKAALGEDIDTTTESHVGRMLEQTALMLRSAIGFGAANVMQTDLGCATGRYLDALGFLFFAERKSAVATRINITLSNSTASAITVYADACSVKDANGVTFNLAADVTVPAASGGTAGSVLASFVCEEAGAVVPDETSTTWTKPDGITAGAFGDVETGYDEESDDAFRARLKASRVTSVGFLESVKTAILALDGVYDVLVIENTSSATATIKGVPMAGHSIVAYVDFDGTDSAAQNVAQELFNHKAVGCGYTDNLNQTTYGTKVTRTVTDSSFGTEYTVPFYKPKDIPVYLAVTVTRNEYSGKDLETDVKNAIVSWANGDVPYVDGLKIGHSVKAYEIGAAISVRIPEIQIDEVLLGTSSASRTSSKVTINAYQLASIASGNINVTIV